MNLDTSTTYDSLKFVSLLALSMDHKAQRSNPLAHCLDAIHEDQVSLIQGRMVASTWNYDFCDDHNKKPCIHLETTNMEVLDLNTRVPQALPIGFHFVEHLHNTNFTFPHLNSLLPKCNNILPSIFICTPLTLDNSTSFLNCKLVKNTFTKLG